MKKPLPPTYFTVSLIVMSLLHYLLPIFTYFPFPHRLVGLFPLAIGIYLNIKADRKFKIRATTVKPFEESSYLVEEFPFSASRNPMYLGMALILLGVALLLGTVGALVPVVSFPVIIDRRFIRVEEQMLSATFGTSWDEYCSRVRRWL
jgi:protein-S-isoprenylcysteine O-methyltransferase Ste14